MGRDHFPKKRCELLRSCGSRWKAIAALENFEGDPTITVSTRKLVLLNEFCWDVCDFDVDILWGRALGGINVEFLEVDGAKVYNFARDHTVEQQLEEFKGCGVGADIPRVTDAIASDDDAGMIRIIFIGRGSTDKIIQNNICPNSF